jgi:hypothetical protein
LGPFALYLGPFALYLGSFAPDCGDFTVYLGRLALRTEDLRARARAVGITGGVAAR